MQDIIIDKPYEFVPPHRSRFWPMILKHFVPGYLKRNYGILDVECRDTEHLRRSLDAGHGILLTPNHSRMSDPMLMGMLTRTLSMPVYAMASWHLFMENRFMAWLLRRMGAFSVYREGMDRKAVHTAIEILQKAERPLIIFPEGMVSRTNDLLGTLMEGTAFIARTAAKRRAKAPHPGKVVVHPVAVKYYFKGDLQAKLEPVLERIEHRLSWQPQKHLSLLERITKLGDTLLTLKEIEHFGKAELGDRYHRINKLIDHLLVPLEQKWFNGNGQGDVVVRVKKLRSAILTDMVNGEISEQQRQEQWRHLADVYLAQQLCLYPRDYIREHPSPERYLEIVEKFEEDLTDVTRIRGPLSAVIQVGPAIEVDPRRQRGTTVDPLMKAIETGLTSMLQELAAQSRFVENNASSFLPDSTREAK